MMYAIDSKEKVEYNGLYYHLRIRTQDERNPVVLFLHGGCGSPDRAQVMRFQSPRTRRSGKSLKNGTSVSAPCLT